MKLDIGSKTTTSGWKLFQFYVWLLDVFLNRIMLDVWHGILINLYQHMVGNAMSIDSYVTDDLFW